LFDAKHQSVERKKRKKKQKQKTNQEQTNKQTNLNATAQRRIGVMSSLKRKVKTTFVFSFG
jgi:hypothetical protein